MMKELSTDTENRLGYISKEAKFAALGVHLRKVGMHLIGTTIHGTFLLRWSDDKDDGNIFVYSISSPLSTPCSSLLIDIQIMSIELSLLASALAMTASPKL